MEALAVAPALEEVIISEAETRVLSTNDIAALAYRLWQERGCPIGSPEEDWLRAEELLTAGAQEPNL
ncbi:MAG: DUF2934 domain-containing protein [Bryobacteraceae bacterium]|jgi:hypothetical protein